MTEVYREAFTEVNEILKYLDEELLKKIPREFMNNIRENMSTSYILKYDKTKGINEQSLKQETRAILSVIYRDYICDEQKREEIIQKDRRQWFDLEQKKKEEYENKGMLKTYIQTQNLNENKALQVIEKQNIISKIIENIRNIWRKIHG